MTFVRTNEPKSRVVALVAVLALHMLLLVLAQRVSSVAHRIEQSVEHALVWLRLDPIESPRPEPESQPPTQSSRPVPTAAPTPTREAPQETAQPTTTPLPPRQIDWRANAARSAQAAVEAAGQEQYRSFGPRPEQPKDPSQAPSAFNDQPKHKYGDTDLDAGGDPIIWMNDNCYTELDKRVQTARDWVSANPGTFAGPQIRCVSRGSAPNSHMFDHIKKREEPPVPKAGTEMNPLPERVDRSDDGTPR